ncbi:MAG: amino acid ABC transporter permease [Pseudomonadota bacterium]
MADTSYVRTEMLPEQAPPPSTIGLIGWFRQNLFNGWANSILTLLALYFIYVVLKAIVPWIFVPSWSGNDVHECRALVAAAWGEGHHGACWGVIRERWVQLLFGFYPKELYWRPILAFILLFVALAPILFASVPRKLLIFSAIFPFLMVWLLWGGTLWLPISVILGFVIGWVLFKATLEHAGALIANLLLILAPIIWWLTACGGFANLMHGIIPIGIEPVESAKFGGFMLSITIGLVGIALSLPLGILLALGRQSDLIILKAVCVGFIEFIRGVPLITLLFVASTLLNIFMPPGTNFDIILRVIIMVTLFASAYMAEVIRGGLAALPKGQYEAADSLGLDYAQATRLIIMPQALKISIPGIVGTFIGLFKDTVLVSIIGLLDPVGLKQTINGDVAWTGLNWEIYGFICLIFFIFCFGMSRYSMYLERKLATGHH